MPIECMEVVSVGYIHCCGGLRKTRSFVLVPVKNFVICELDCLNKCPRCGNYIIQLTRIDDKDNISTVRYTNSRAQKFWKAIESKILYEEKFINYQKYKGGKLFLYYNEYGVKKRCYSNISNLKQGQFTP
ncbi:MAG: hypothetical protein SPL73_06240 [Cyanobacteriota bacterium]|nr:hypothetical protein [Cyanobacteriota bacterium]